MKRFGKDTSSHCISIRRVIGRKTKYQSTELYFSNKLRGLYGNYRFVELFLSDGYLGIKFLTEETADSYRITPGTHRKDKIRASILNKITPKFYVEDELELDVKNKMLVVPITLDKPLEEGDFDYGFVEVAETLKKDTAKESSQWHIKKDSSS